MARLTDLEETAKFYDICMSKFVSYEKLLCLNSYYLKYETLIQDFQGTLRALLSKLKIDLNDHLNNFNKAAQERHVIKTPSYSQITKPLYQNSAHRWKNYDENVSRIKPVLLKLCKYFDYSI